MWLNIINFIGNHWLIWLIAFVTSLALLWVFNKWCKKTEKANNKEKESKIRLWVHIFTTSSEISGALAAITILVNIYHIL